MIVEEKIEFVKKHTSLGIDVDKITPYTPIPFSLNKIWYDLVYFDTVNWLDKEMTAPAVIDNGDIETLKKPKFRPAQMHKKCETYVCLGDNTYSPGLYAIKKSHACFL